MFHQRACFFRSVYLYFMPLMFHPNASIPPYQCRKVRRMYVHVWIFPKALFPGRPPGIFPFPTQELSPSLLPPDEFRPAGIFQIFLAFQSDYQLTCKKVPSSQLSHEPGGLCVVATSDCQVASVWLKDSRVGGVW